MRDSEPDAPKAIAIFADGTGNSASKLFKTNVQRLYEALETDGPAQSRQVAYYHDGVGTSSFRPLALLGGAFGWGLKRNVLDLYVYLCRTYRPGDRIYVFGFSRGAFTVRLLVGVIVTQGLLTGLGEEALIRYSRDAYRAYRRRFNQTGGLVTALRNLRDAGVRLWRQAWKHPSYAEVARTGPVAVEFVGVWDTVAAYGMPLAELTRGIAVWVWPLSMPNYVLSPLVKEARHALALDDERDTFHPLLWDELAEQTMIDKGEVRDGRLRQVWFAGMHSDVGGGYPIDSLAHVPLLWMLREAEAAGLRFKPAAVEELERKQDPSGPMHDSRQGLAGYYRYQPRKISAKVEPADDTALIMRDPGLHGKGLLRSVRLHESVLERIGKGADGYAPIVIPQDYGVVRRDRSIVSAPESADSAAARRRAQDVIWNNVWRKRINYFAMVAVSLALASVPFIAPNDAACIAPPCAISPLAWLVGGFLPGFAQLWIDSYARHPEWLLAGLLVLTLLLWRSATLQRRIGDAMRPVWQASLKREPAIAKPRRLDAWIHAVRTHAVYQRSLQSLKWTILPGIFGIALLIAGVLTALAVPAYVYLRHQLLLAEQDGRYCRGAPEAGPRFDTKALCWDLGQEVEADTRYRLTLKVLEPWRDASIDASPEGFGADRASWPVRLGTLFRRSIADRWFQPIVEIRDESGGVHLRSLEMRRFDAAPNTFAATFEAPASGRLFLFVNDAIILCCGLERTFYENNAGVAEVALQPLPRTAGKSN